MSLPVCKFYILNQTCRFGKNCRYSHFSQRPPPNLDSSPDKNHEESIEGHSTVQALETHTENLSLTQEDNHHHASVNKIPSNKEPSFQNTGYTKNYPQNAVLRKDQEAGEANICRHFARSGKCYYGRNCRFVHSTPDRDTWTSKNRGGHGRFNAGQSTLPPRFRSGGQAGQRQVQHEYEDVSVGENLRGTSNESSKDKASSQGGESGLARTDNRGQRICPFFKARRCNRGSNCKFLHPGKSSNNGPYNEKERNEDDTKERAKEEPQEDQCTRQNSRANAHISQRPVGVVRQIFTFSELEELGLSNVRESEVNTIKKRFPHDRITVIKENEEMFTVRIIFNPSDPDWPFDVKTFELVLTLPCNYPQETLSVKLPTDQNMPETVRRYIEVTISEWLQERERLIKTKGKVELVFRPFLRWFDRNLEEVTTEALKQLKRELVAKAAGMEFLSPAQLQAKLRAEASDSGDSGETESEEEEEDSSTDGEDFEDETDDEEEEEEKPSLSLNLDPEKKGTQIELKHLQLKENASAVLLDRLKLVLQCGRCKNHADLTIQQTKVMSLSCVKCNQNQFVHFRAALAHQFSSVVGYLDLDGCQAFDLILQDCRAVVTCMGCSKLTRLEGLVAGQMVDGWCQACNAKFKLATEGVKFTQLAPSGVNTANSQKVEVAKSRRPPKDPAIREGYPLPEFGTCKHYKHSYRWLRFPCCGKAYPCDVCHDKKEDHEFIYATRMICGHCCKEQNYSASRPCNSCSQHLTKIRSAHWEGGKGCRDKISMSKNDTQKYRNMHKTQSNAKKKAQSGGKKNTKLRHA